MDLTICGSGAAEAFPALFCSCGYCSEGRKRGGKNIRSRSAYALGDEIRIDWGPDSNLHSQRYNLNSGRMRHLLVTHSHWDHWVPEELYWRKGAYAVMAEDLVLSVYGNAKVRKRLRKVLGRRLEAYRLEFYLLTPYIPLTLSGESEVTVIPIPATHDRSETCLNYLLQMGGKTILQGNDTGWYEEPTWEFLADYKSDVVIFDSTLGKQEGRTGHLSCKWVVEACRKLEAQGSLAAEARLVATHFSHNGGWLHEELEEYFDPHGIEVAYDGLRIPL